MPAKGSGLPRETRFWSHVNKDGPILRPDLGPCWIWTAATDKDGYGLFKDDAGKMRRATGVAWELAGGESPNGRHILHTCDNPPCVHHLFLGTPLDNQRDAMRKGRHTRGERHGAAKLTEQDVRDIRIAWRLGASRAELSERYDVSVSLISHITTRRKWKHVT
jgi:hypothetical protein